MGTDAILNVLVVDDDKFFRETMVDYLSASGFNIDKTDNGISAIELVESNDYDLVLLDINMPGIDGLTLLPKIQELSPDISVVMVSGAGGMDNVIQALRLGATDYITKPVNHSDLDAAIEKIKRIHLLRKDRAHLRDTIRHMQFSDDGFSNTNLVGVSSSMNAVREHIDRVIEAGCDTILIRGETGTGKEVVARKVHFLGHSDESPFIAVNCPALPESLVESELFGHKKGTFTGAQADRKGYFELADGGTLFLDEVADLSPSAQAKLLRALETRSIRRVGGDKEIKVNVRIIAASNVPLEKLVEEGRFRRDLYYRLNLYSIEIDPLRDRRDDIIPLAEHFLHSYTVPRGLNIDGFSKEAQEKLVNYNFPGNARELKNLVERAAMLCRSGMIGQECLAVETTCNVRKPAKTEATPVAKGSESEMIRQALEETKWNRRDAAKVLKMPYSTLRYKIDKFGIS